jgi:hypothetical protein
MLSHASDTESFMASAVIISDGTTLQMASSASLKLSATRIHRTPQTTSFELDPHKK